MIFLSTIIILHLILFLVLCRYRNKNKFSHPILALLIFSVIASTSLAQNYTNSLISGIHDGIGISNTVASWIITDSGWGRQWTVSLFKSAYDISALISVVLLILYLIVFAVEAKINKQRY